MKKITIAALSLWLFASCEKDDRPLPPGAPGKYENGLLVLNEGLYQQNNASLCFYSFDDHQVYTQSFFTENGRGLGDTANDFEKFTKDGKVYILIVVDISSQVEIVEASTLKSVAQIPLFDGSDAREPRRIEIYGDKAFVCSFDGTVSVIDLVSFALVTTIPTGANPEDMAQIGNKLYVANSGGLNFPVYDSTVTVINMDTYAVETTFDTRINCTSMIVDAQQDIYLVSNGNYTTVEPALLRINTITNEVAGTYEMPVRYMTQVGDWIYFYDNESMGIRRFNTLTETAEENVLLDCSDYETFYGMQYNDELGLLFCFDVNGYVNSSVVRAYDYDGEPEFEFTAELNARKIIYNE